MRERSGWLIEERLARIRALRPNNAMIADKVLARAVACYNDGTIHSVGVQGSAAKLEAILRRDIPDLAIVRSPRSVSSKPKQAGLMIMETRAPLINGQRFVSALHHTVVLAESSVAFITSVMPGGTRPHLFERILERRGDVRSLADAQNMMSRLWPTLVWMRNEQRRAGRGSPVHVTITPFGNGLLFGALEKVDGLPASGPLVVLVSLKGQEQWQLEDPYGDNGTRIWAMTKTFVGGQQLKSHQLQLRDYLTNFMAQYPDVIAYHDWLWKFGLGDRNPEVERVTQTFRLQVPPLSRCALALSDLELIVGSDLWAKEAAINLENQGRPRRRRSSRFAPD